MVPVQPMDCPMVQYSPTTTALTPHMSVLPAPTAPPVTPAAVQVPRRMAPATGQLLPRQACVSSLTPRPVPPQAGHPGQDLVQLPIATDRVFLFGEHLSCPPPTSVVNATAAALLVLSQPERHSMAPL